jgi:hypothetical protein
MTPNERLNPVDRNELLSSILKFFFPGSSRITRSTHIIDASVALVQRLPLHNTHRKHTSKRARCNTVSLIPLHHPQASTYLCRSPQP